MPTYEFRCPQGHEFEKFYRSIGTAEAQAVCPDCGQQAERMLSATGFAFKGSGFYLTDYGKNAHRGSAAPESKSAASTPSSSEGSGSSGSGGGDAKAAAPAAEAKPAPAPAKKSTAE